MSAVASEGMLLEKINSSSVRVFFPFLIGAVLVCAAAGATYAQPTAIRAVERENSARENAREERSRKRDPNEVMAEVNDDLRQLNELNAGLAMFTAANNQPLDYGSIVASSLEIKKRSTRLRTDLALPKNENKEKPPEFKEAEQGELQPALSALNKLLDSFLHNPIFSDAGEIDVQLATKARRELDSIVVLSEKLRKNAERRSKTSSKSQS
jgi:hypothetical protein